jgi:hypothetical protein
MEWLVKENVSTGLDFGQLDFYAHLLQSAYDYLRLPEGQRASPGSHY